jgi:hypothetical protein
VCLPQPVSTVASGLSGGTGDDADIDYLSIVNWR